MKLFAKIFLCTIGVTTAALSVFGYLFISTSFANTIERENQRGIEEYQLLKFTLQAGVLNAGENADINRGQLTALAEQTADIAPTGNMTAIFDKDKTLVYSNFPASYHFSNLNEIDSGDLSYMIENVGGKHYLLVAGYFEQSGQAVYLSTARDVSSVILEKQEMQQRYITIFIAVLCASAIIMLLFSMLLTNPIKRLKHATTRIANGEYRERVKVTTKDETGELGESFNLMAETIEDKINELELTAQQKEDFVANFAHELKTPLTSVIGYADMLYQKDLGKDEIKEAASYIMNEGMHLEALSFKLMELIVLGKQEFMLEELRVDELIEDITGSFMPMMDKSGVKLACDMQPAYIYVEFDLMKTLLLNLIDNAVKAESRHIHISGVARNHKYIISVEDDGVGIPEKELSRITEAFYMIDKSRSRKQHGAGLGLSIAARIAEIHGTALSYQSQVGEGTTVSFALDMKGGPYEK